MKRRATAAEINRAFDARRKALGRAMTYDEIQALDAELFAVVERDDVPAGYLQIGVSEDGRDIIVNHPDLQADANGVGHIVFSPDQARAFAKLLLEKARECEAAHSVSVSPVPSRHAALNHSGRNGR